MVQTNQTIDLNKIAAKVKELFDKEKSDESMAEELKMPVQQVIAIRGLLKLFRKHWTNVFEESKKLSRDMAHEAFLVSFRIPPQKMNEVGLDWKNDYEYRVSCAKEEITIEFMKKLD